MTTDKQLQDLFNQLNRFFPVTSGGGNVGDLLWVKLNGKKVQATCHHNLKAGECLAILADDGQYYLVNSQESIVNSQSTRIIQTRRTDPPSEKPIPPSFKVLFSLVNGSVREFYIGGDRPQPLKVFELPATATIQSAYVHNLGKKPQFEVAISYKLTGSETFYYTNIVNSQAYTFNNQLIGNTYTYKGAATWITSEQNNIIFYQLIEGLINGSPTNHATRNKSVNNQKATYDYTGANAVGLFNSGMARARTISFTLREITTLTISGVFTPPDGTFNQFVAFGINRMPTNGGISGNDPENSDYSELDASATWETELPPGDYYIGFLYFVVAGGIPGGLPDLPLIGYFNVEATTLREQNLFLNKALSGSNIGDINYTAQTNTSFYDTIIENILFSPTPPFDLYYQEHREGDLSPSNYNQITAKFLVMRGEKSFIYESLNYLDRFTNQFDKSSLYYLGSKELKSDIGMTLNAAFTLTLATTSVSVTLSSAFLPALSYQYTVTGVFDGLVGKSVLLAKNNLLGKGTITSYSISGGNVTFNVEVTSVSTEPFISFSTATGRIILDSQSVFEYLISKSATSRLLLNESQATFYNALFSIDTPTDSPLSDLSYYVGDRLKTDNLVKSKIFVSQINEDMKTGDITGYAEEWNIDGEGNFIRQDTLREGLIYSLGNASATIHGISYWAQK